MDLYKILLVDDEMDVLRAMKKKIDWEAMGFCLAGLRKTARKRWKWQSSCILMW